MLVAYRFGIVDAPDGKLKVHAKITPYLGGCAISCGFLSTICIAYTYFLWPISPAWSFFFIGVFLLLLVGLLDDIMRFKPFTKLLGQAIAAFFLLYFLSIAGSFWTSTSVIGFVVAYFWLLAVINAFNLIDVMDGLATITAIAIAAQLAALAQLQQEKTLVLMLISFIGAVSAFFWYNKPQARIYMGDAGSLFIGGFLAAAALLIPWPNYSWAIVGPVSIFFIPLFELCSLICIRFLKGIPFYQGSPDHFCHYLLRDKWQKEQILAYIFISKALFTIPLLFLWNNGVSAWLLAIFPLIMVSPFVCIICKINMPKKCCFFKKEIF